MTLRFGTDGVRGVANVELTSELVTALGRAAARVLGSDAAVRGRPRHAPLGPDARGGAGRGHLRRGRRRRARRRAPHARGRARRAASAARPAAVISASHNPFGDNGIKLFAPGGRKIPDAARARGRARAARARGRRSPSRDPRGSASACRASTAARSTTTSRTLVDSLAGPPARRAARGARLRQRRRVPRRAHRARARSAPTVDVHPRRARRREHQRRLRLDAPRASCRRRCS